jgi:ech hydrogenase subunit D
MTQPQTYEAIPVASLLDRVRAARAQGQRLVQISTTRLPEEFELTYSFDIDTRLTNLRVLLPANEPIVPSISSIYGCSVLYENEMHDLFGVKVEGMTLDFQGGFYKTAVKYAFGSPKVPAAAPKPAAAAAVTPAAPTPA